MGKISRLSFWVAVWCQRCAACPCMAEGRQENLPALPPSLSARWGEGVTASSNPSALGPEIAVLVPGFASGARGL